jgi:fermentation-respiration switch protein FrsA (DUF1100 family)
MVLIATPHSVARLVRDFGQSLAFTPRLQRALADQVTRAARRPVESITTGDLLRVAGRPALIIQDDDDEVVPATDGPLIAGACGGTLHTTRGLGHRRIVIMPTVVRTSIRYLKGEPL